MSEDDAHTRSHARALPLTRAHACACAHTHARARVHTLAGKDALRGLKKLRCLAFLNFPKKRTKTRVLELHSFFVPDYTGTIILHCKYLKDFEYTSCVGVPSTKFVYLPGRTIEAGSRVNLVPVPGPLYSI